MTELPDLNDGVAKSCDHARILIQPAVVALASIMTRSPFAHNWKLTGNNWVGTRCEMRPHFE
jgi:hypothetical protein